MGSMRRIINRIVVAALAFVAGVGAFIVWVDLRIPVVEQLEDQLPYAAYSERTPLSTTGLPMKLLVWNQAGTHIRIKVLVDNTVIYDSIAEVATVYPAIVVSEEFRIKPGFYRVTLLDEARGVRRQADVMMSEKARLKVLLNPEETKLSVSYRDEVYE